MSEIKLKPCPFCGGEAVVKMEKKKTIGEVIWCECKECCARTSGYCPNLSKPEKALEEIGYCKALAIEKWSTRRPIERIVEQLERIDGTADGTVSAAIEIVQKGGAE